jgi:hypothetical protein
VVTLATIMSLIGATHSAAGLRVRSELDRRRYLAAVVVSDAPLARIDLKHHAFDGDWNYTIHARTASSISQLLSDDP